nr:M56 family metallopeptidase [Salsipaludibacter albus]
MSAQFGLRSPQAAVVECPGGAAAVGIRRPVLLLDEALLAELDPAELEGVVAHELAHVARRDNLIALAFGIARDLTFFVPGGTWAVRHLLVERELAADQAAIGRTRRPGALAGGLMKVLDAGSDRVEACAALMPSGTLATRVAVLCDDDPAPGVARHAGEALALLGTFVLLVAIATVVPRALAGDDPETALGLYVAGAGEQAVPGAEGPAAPTAPPARALATYHDSVDQPAQANDAAPEPTGRAELLDVPGNLNGGMLRACATGGECGITEPDSSTLELRPQPVLVEADIELRWHARQIAHGGDFRVYQLSSLDLEGAAP